MLFNNNNIFNTLDKFNDDIKNIIYKFIYLEDNLKIIKKQKQLKYKLNKEIRQIYRISNDIILYYFTSTLSNIYEYLNSNVNIQYIDTISSNIYSSNIIDSSNMYISNITIDIYDYDYMYSSNTLIYENVYVL